MSSVFSIFPGRVALSPVEAGAAAFGWSSATTRYRLCRGTFPLPVTEIGGKKVVTLAALAVALGEQEPAPVVAAPAAPAVVTPAAPARRGRGRPRKIGGEGVSHA